MIRVDVTLRDGSTKTVEGSAESSLMEVLRDGGIDELLALCGGCCSCATCHVLIEGAPHWIFGPANADEEDLLDSSDSRGANSRLSCQINLTEAMDGLRLRIAPED